jgi:sugar phosphate isomerase/epimerase
MVSHPVPAPRRQVALSTASVYPDRTPDAFEVAARLGYDGVEVMVTPDAVSQDVDVLRRLSDYHGVPVLAVHAPCLLITQRVWGWDPWGKLTRAKDVAEQLGAQVVVVHPPFRWQRDYARDFGTGLARMQQETDVVFAVENMFPIRAGGAEVAPYAPTWNPVHMDYPHITLDLSHTAVSGSDALAMAAELGGRLAHVHLADGTGMAYRDEHLVPGRGTQPCAPLLHKLVADDYPGIVVLEVKTFRAATQQARLADLAEALQFARDHLSGSATLDEPAAPGPAGAAPPGPGAAGPGASGPAPAAPAAPGGANGAAADPAHAPSRSALPS